MHDGTQGAGAKSSRGSFVAREVPPVQPKSKPHCVGSFADANFRAGILALDFGHYGRPALSRNLIDHLGLRNGRSRLFRGNEGCAQRLLVLGLHHSHQAMPNPLCKLPTA